MKNVVLMDGAAGTTLWSLAAAAGIIMLAILSFKNSK